MIPPANVIVTGANRGIGKAICQLILSRPEYAPLKLFATSRKGENLDFLPNSHNDVKNEVLYPKLDISNSHSIQSFAEEVKQHGPVQVLINNAGVNLDAQYGPENARKTLDVNYRGTLGMCQAFIPHLAPQGRIVNMSSVSSTLKPYSEQMRARFRNPDMTLGQLEQLVQDYEHAVSTHTESISGFIGPGRSYAFSKSLINSMTRILARENPGLMINACCPGWVKTDMGLLIGRAPKTPADGAEIPVRLAFGDIGGVTGRYWANASVRSKEEGEVQEW